MENDRSAVGFLAEKRGVVGRLFRPHDSSPAEGKVLRQNPRQRHGKLFRQENPRESWFHHSR